MFYTFFILRAAGFHSGHHHHLEKRISCWCCLQCMWPVNNFTFMHRIFSLCEVRSDIFSISCVPQRRMKLKLPIAPLPSLPSVTEEQTRITLRLCTARKSQLKLLSSIVLRKAVVISSTAQCRRGWSVQYMQL